MDLQNEKGLLQMEVPMVYLPLSATMSHCAMAGPMERLHLALAASDAARASGTSEILPPPVNQAGQPKHPTVMGASLLNG
jgi:hypothetical protein